MPLRRARFLVLAALAGAVVPAIARAGDDALVFNIRAHDGRFEPSELRVPANRPFALHVTSEEETAIEFESFELHRERVVQPGGTITVLMPALAPGTYKFFDDFHHETPEGSIIVQ